ncbi:VacB/RNase II family 3'-5' exoribonuclease [Dankookia sp. P2]|uniref:VacB/RNase II family 3'-5' exoribonuclease n=1 Tax=Dankookia sp. P2 TaxID=3423955 RepID=UPI003D668B41
MTIDGEDARDFDDAVWAEPDGTGWRVLVAIADVAHYVRPGSALDREAWARGNSVYFPDRVVPMLPEPLSNGWCSLRPGEDRGCLFVEMRIDAGGTKTVHRFGRGIMRSAARLTYEQAQADHDAGEDPTGTLAPLYGAFRALLAARDRRGTLELDLPERRVRLDPAGTVLGVEPRARLDSHRLIEEFMVTANVCAAEELERLSQPLPCTGCMTGPPTRSWRGCASSSMRFGIGLPPGDRIHPRDFAHVLALVADRPEARLVHETVLRSRSQAAYAPDNIGHFGLALGRYAHFTSPIRRYADLLVHRALVRGLKLDEDGLQETEAARFPDTGEHITQTERRAAAAERDAVDRYLAAYMSQRIGEVFDARISGVTRFGLFVTVEANGASGIVPLASLPDDRWTEDQARHALSGQRTGISFALGQAVEARLVEATPRTGGMVFHLMQGMPAAHHAPKLRKAKPGKRKAGKGGRPASLTLLLLLLFPAGRRRAGTAFSRASRCRRCWPRRSAPCWSVTSTSSPRPSSASGACAGSRCWSQLCNPSCRATRCCSRRPTACSRPARCPSCRLRGRQRPRRCRLRWRCPACSTPLGGRHLQSAGPAPNACCGAPSRSCSTISTPTAATHDAGGGDGGAGAADRPDRTWPAAGGGSRQSPCLIATIRPDSPAAEAGLRVGDRVLTAEGVPLSAQDLAAAAALLEGPAGTEVALRVARGNRRFTVLLLRSTVPPETLHAQRREEILWLQLDGFSNATDLRLTEALLEAFPRHWPARGVVLDLRGNRGGLLGQAVAVASAFLAEGVVALTSGRHPDAARTYVSAGPDLARGVPLVVLVDGRTASAAEIVAAALSDRGRGVVVGSATTGKGLIQAVVPLPNGGELLVTWSRVLAPRGWPIQGLGVLPAVCTSLGTEATAAALARLRQGDSSMARPLARLRAARAPVPGSEVTALRNTCPPAEGRPGDLGVARTLIEQADAYESALAR